MQTRYYETSVKLHGAPVDVEVEYTVEPGRSFAWVATLEAVRRLDQGEQPDILRQLTASQVDDLEEGGLERTLPELEQERAEDACRGGDTLEW